MFEKEAKWRDQFSVIRPISFTFDNRLYTHNTDKLQMLGESKSLVLSLYNFVFSSL